MMVSVGALFAMHFQSLAVLHMNSNLPKKFVCYDSKMKNYVSITITDNPMYAMNLTNRFKCFFFLLFFSLKCFRSVADVLIRKIKRVACLNYKF